MEKVRSQIRDAEVAGSNPVASRRLRYREVA